MSSTTNDHVDSSGNVEFGELRKCRIHGLLFDAEIVETCPVCESERADRLGNG